MRKKRLLFIIWSFSYGGGAERVLADLVNHLDKDKYDIFILEYWFANKKIMEVNENIHVLPPVIDATKASKVEMIVKKFLLEHFPKVLRKKYLPKESFDYEISFNCMIPTFLLSKNGKTIAWNHGDVYDLNLRDRKLQNGSFKNVNRIVAISNNTYRSLVELFPHYKEKTMVIPNAYDFDGIYKNCHDEIELKKTKFTAIFAGRLDKNKNPLFLVNVARILKENGNNFEFWFIGQGDLKEDILQKIKEYELEDYVKLLGFKNNPYPYFNASDIVVLSSKSEGFPSVLAEGLILRKPFVSTLVGGVEELSQEGNNGYVAQTEEEYASKVELLINDKKLYTQMSKNGKEYISSYTFDKQIKALENLFKEIDDEELK